MSDLLALAERVEKATAEEQAELIGDAWDAIGPITRPTGERAGRFARMMDAEAYESAAMMLVPEGVEGLPLSFNVEKFYLGNGIWKCRASVWCGLTGVSSLDTATEAATPALALCAASLRALSDLLPNIGES